MPFETKRATFLDKTQQLRRALSASGHDPRDFDIEADHTSPLANLFKLAGGLLIVRRRSTGEERAYATDTESAWLDSVMADLSHGRLADAPETAPAVLSMLPHEDSVPAALPPVA
ncbi:hypothetical protein [Rhizobacter sp. Root1221]|uniref:hypothetical protein n=1 Tax=Rhizobacter sp. Root1221 TaxID=1736433 RepID=UPI0006F1D849|nr:hypothetical protein [Rhizobacter sp. Root1221]KQW00619.1 hypothetical protein ASC87_17325 [Rhizobacter sp. Root1221]